MDRNLQWLKHRWERLTKTHRFVWRPQEVASRGVVGFENIHEFKWFAVFLPRFVGLVQSLMVKLSHKPWLPYTLWITQWEELKFLVGINHNCTMYISISYEHHKWYVIACKELHCPGSNIFICFLTKLVVVWVKWVWLQQLGWLWGKFFFGITLPTARP